MWVVGRGGGGRDRPYLGLEEEAVVKIQKTLLVTVFLENRAATISSHRAVAVYQTHLSVEVQSPAENGQSVLDGRIVHATLVETVHGELLLFLELFQDSTPRASRHGGETRYILSWDGKSIEEYLTRCETLLYIVQRAM